MCIIRTGLLPMSNAFKNHSHLLPNFLMLIRKIVKKGKINFTKLTHFSSRLPFVNFIEKNEIVCTWKYLRNAVDLLERQVNKKNGILPSERMCRFLILAEDHRYGKHWGFDPIALIRAIWMVYFCNSKQGGSTIAMQLVRTLTHRREITLWRKVTEITLAVLLTRYISGDRLPVVYLCCAYYGWRMNNFEQACSRLGIDPNFSTPKDDVEFVARLKYPQPQNPTSQRMDRISRRGRHILKLSVHRKIRYQHFELVETHV